MNTTPRDGWWHRNRLLLAIAVVLIPLTVAIIGVQEWWLRFSENAIIAVDTEPGTAIGGAQWQRIIWADRTQDVDSQLPEGARMLVVELRVVPQGEPVTCRTPVLRDNGGDGREWAVARSGLRPEGVDVATDCPNDSTAPFDLVLPYLVPADAEGLVLDVDLPELRPRYLRFTLSD